jgi:hypothetical protein
MSKTKNARLQKVAGNLLKATRQFHDFWVYYKVRHRLFPEEQNQKKEKPPLKYRLKRLFKKDHFTKIQRQARKAGIQPITNIGIEKTKKVALELAREFSYFTIANIDTETDTVSEVYGYLKVYYTAEFQALIDNNVIEIACFYARRHSRKEIVKFLDGIDLEKLVKTKAYFKRAYTFDNYPNIEFDRAILLAEKRIKEVLNYKSKKEDMEGFPVSVKLAPCDFILLGWFNINTPILLVKSVPGEDSLIHRAKIEAKKLRDMEKRIYQKGIHKLKAKLDDRNDAVTREKINADDWKTEYVHLSKNVSAERRRNIRKIHQQNLNRYGYMTGAEPFDKKKALIALLVIGGGVLIFIAIFMGLGGGGIGGNNTTTNNTQPANESVTLSLFKSIYEMAKLYFLM